MKAVLSPTDFMSKIRFVNELASSKRNHAGCKFASFIVISAHCGVISRGISIAEMALLINEQCSI